MPVRVVVTITATKGNGEALAKAIGANLPNVQKEPGCQQYTLFRNIEDPDKLVMLERWTDRPALDAHLVRARANAPIQPSLRVGPSALEFYDIP